MIVEKRWLSTKNSQWLQRCKAIFVIPTAHGREAQMKTQTGSSETFFSKGTDFNLVTKEKLNWVQNALNERPRKTLEFNTSKETFNSLLLND